MDKNDCTSKTWKDWAEEYTLNMWEKRGYKDDFYKKVKPNDIASLKKQICERLHYLFRDRITKDGMIKVRREALWICLEERYLNFDLDSEDFNLFPESGEACNGSKEREKLAKKLYEIYMFDDIRKEYERSVMEQLENIDRIYKKAVKRNEKEVLTGEQKEKIKDEIGAYAYKIQTLLIKYYKNNGPYSKYLCCAPLSLTYN